jgi:hypothetical protein
MTGQVGSLIHTHAPVKNNTGASINMAIEENIISKSLLMILHHAVIDIDDNSIIGISHIQFSHNEFSGMYFDIFGYMSGIPYILDSENILLIQEWSPIYTILLIFFSRISHSISRVSANDLYI